ncbi:MAG TPA: rhodanese-like domain-containing protein [Chloroflexi bacterium]|nr:rhodanese-like domain-containing protein [Chloroflexota bacterium]
MSKRQTYSLAIALAALALFAAACSPIPPGGSTDGYTVISVERLAEMLENEDFVLVNTHIPYEGEIPQTDLFIPFDEIADHLDELSGKDAKIVLYCRSGSMSTTAAETLVGLGYTDIYEVDGGIRAWEAAGYELIFE